MKTLFIAVDFDPEHFDADFDNLKRAILEQHRNYGLAYRFSYRRPDYARQYDVIPADGPDAALERLLCDPSGNFLVSPAVKV